MYSFPSKFITSCKTKFQISQKCPNKIDVFISFCSEELGLKCDNLNLQTFIFVQIVLKTFRQRHNFYHLQINQYREKLSTKK